MVRGVAMTFKGVAELKRGSPIPKEKTAVDCRAARRISVWGAVPIYVQSDYPVYIWQSNTEPEGFISADDKEDE